MKKLILSSLVLPILAFSFQDLGKEGFTYKIVEPNFLTMLEDGVKEINTEEVKNKIKKDFVVQATGENNLSICKKDKRIKEFDYVELQEDLYTPTGRLFQKKGTKMTSYLEQPLNICFVDGSNDIVLKNQIDYFDKKTNKSCIYMVTDRNIMDVYKIYPERNREMYPSKKKFEERFKVKCTPTLVHLVKNDRIKFELNIDKFKHKQ